MQRSIKIIQRGEYPFKVAMASIFIDEYSKPGEQPKPTFGYRVDDGCLFLYTEPYSPNPNITVFPYPFNKEQSIAFAWGWLEHQEPVETQYGGDGSSYKGFQVTTEKTGWQDTHQSTFVRIKPVWIFYGK